MRHSDESEICKQAVEVFGKETQQLMFFEECGELFQALSKHNRGMRIQANVAEEIADVEIMLEQLKHIYRCHNEVNKIKSEKIVRLLKRVERQKKVSL